MPPLWAKAQPCRRRSHATCSANLLSRRRQKRECTNDTNQRRGQTRLERDPTDKKFNPLFRLWRYGLGNRCRHASSTAPASRDHGGGTAKQPERSPGAQVAYRPKTRDDSEMHDDGRTRDDSSTHAQTVASVTSTDSARYGSCGGAASTAATPPSRQSVEDGAEMRAGCGTESPDERAHDVPGPDDDEPGQPASSSPYCHPKTEFEANFAATPIDSRGLYLRYYESAHGALEIEQDDRHDYWEWDRAREQWFHVDANTKSVIWFVE
ncbi:hypothetical protein SAMD00023353_8600210 [Rosellinia necatrix]|uniref:Uncharacterized protein n=1 Tax=Rosellinia necatrix TaxID=77044 RepID=A0A1W2TVB2_ROSNE|nr:hypothetical protein SAMD00023353_8600210 [Rosellinia necatrix]